MILFKIGYRFLDYKEKLQALSKVQFRRNISSAQEERQIQMDRDVTYNQEVKNKPQTLHVQKFLVEETIKTNTLISSKGNKKSLKKK